MTSTSDRSSTCPDRAVEQVYRAEWGRLLSLLVSRTRRLDLAEDALGEAFARASDRWPADGVPANPGRLAVHAPPTGTSSGGSGPRPSPGARRRCSPSGPDGCRPATSRERAGRRPPAPHPAVLPPGPPARVAVGAGAPPRHRDADRADRPPVPRAAADDGGAPDPGEEEDRARRHPARRPARRRAPVAARRGVPNDLPGLHRRVHPRARARPAARRPGRATPCGSPPCCTTSSPTPRQVRAMLALLLLQHSRRDARQRGRPPGDPRRPGPLAVAPRRDAGRARRSSPGFGPARATPRSSGSRPSSPPSTPGRPPPPPRTGRRSPATTPPSKPAPVPRSCGSTARSPSPRPRVPGPASPCSSGSTTSCATTTGSPPSAPSSPDGPATSSSPGPPTAQAIDLCANDVERAHLRARLDAT